MPLATKIAAAVVPLLLVGLVTIAWNNSHTLGVLKAELEHVQLDLERRCP